MIKALLPISTQPAVVKRRGRKRCDRARNAILSASIELLEKSPLREVTAEAIAARAGVSNKSLVALEAFLAHMQSAVATPDTGSAQKDFTAQLRSLLRFFKSPYGRIYAQFIAEGQSDSVFMAQFRDGFLKTRRDEVRVMWKRGVARGEICRRIDADVAIDLIYGPVIFRLLTGHAPLNDAQAEAIVAAVFRGLRK
jgi:hypothetical protein